MKLKNLFINTLMALRDEIASNFLSLHHSFTYCLSFFYFMIFAVNAYYFNNSKNVIFIFLSNSSMLHTEGRGLVSRMPP